MPGASGAWNSALAHLQPTAPEVFVAVLDDDDAWEPSYLEQCERTALAHNLDMVAAGIVYHEAGDASGRPLAPPPRLDVNELLVRNTHIQGSNLFVRLRKLLEAGGFDEAAGQHHRPRHLHPSRRLGNGEVRPVARLPGASLRGQ